MPLLGKFHKHNLWLYRLLTSQTWCYVVWLRFTNVLGKLYTTTSTAERTALCHIPEEDNIHCQRRDDVKYRKRVFITLHLIFYGCETSSVKKKGLEGVWGHGLEKNVLELRSWRSTRCCKHLYSDNPRCLLFLKHFQVYKIKQHEMGEACRKHEARKMHTFLVETP